MNRALMLFLGVALLIALPACARSGPPRASEGIVVADHPLAAEAGAAILAQGGNAVDAAVATSFMLAVVRPQSCGIGGGGFMVGCTPSFVARPRGVEDRFAWSLNYRETCPAGIDARFFERSSDQTASTRGGAAVGVPGTVAGLLAAHERFGRLPRETVLAPAIERAEIGFAADEHYANAAVGVIRKFEADPTMRTRYANLWRHALHEGRVQVGSVIRFPGMADTLRAIAQRGDAVFRAGPIAEEIVRAVRERGGVLSLDDLRGVEPVWGKAFTMHIGDLWFLTMPMPSSGGVSIGQVMSLLEMRGAARLPRAGDEIGYTHELIEAFKWAFAERATRVVPGADIRELLEPTELQRKAKATDAMSTFGPEHYVHPSVRSSSEHRDAGTSHLSVIDADGNAVACTETVNLEFGSLILTDAGFILNNEMDDFTTRAGRPNAFGLTQSEANMPGPGKQPLSSMSPTIVIGGDAVLVAGGSGGPRIITSTAQVIANVVYRGDDAATAVTRARVHHQWLPNHVEVERGDEPARRSMIEHLREFGHEVKAAPAREAAVQLAVRKADGKVDGAADPRKGGAAARVVQGKVELLK